MKNTVGLAQIKGTVGLAVLLALILLAAEMASAQTPRAAAKPATGKVDATGAKPATKAATETEAKSGHILSLEQYLVQVRSANPDARRAISMVEAAELGLRQARVAFTPEAYGEYKLFDDRKQPQNANINPQRTLGRNWRVGVRDRTTFGLGADLSYQSGRTTMKGAPAFLSPSDYEVSTLNLQLTQSLWRNGFGEADRAKLEAEMGQARIALLQARFELKQMMLKAENTFWSVVTYNQVVKLQQENTDRARRLRDHMKQRVSMRLFDDVDLLQAQAALESRELELQTSLDERAGLVRTLNTLRGENKDELENLPDLPEHEVIAKSAAISAKRMSREDLRVAFEAASAAANEAVAGVSQLRPQVDLVGNVASNGFDLDTAPAQSEALTGRYPTWGVGIQVSFPLDFGLIRDLKRGAKAAQRAAADANAQASFNEERVWNDLTKQNKEAQGRFQRAVSLEKLTTELVEKERRRLLNGRSTTFQSLQIEQNLAEAQIARTRAQLGLIQLSNVIKQFEEVP